MLAFAADDVGFWAGLAAWVEKLFHGTPWYWAVIGLVGQSLFGIRFLIQWVASEKAGRSIVPMVFWHISMAACVMVLAYGIYRGEPVLIIGQIPGIVAYPRNMVLRQRELRMLKAHV